MLLFTGPSAGGENQERKASGDEGMKSGMDGGLNEKGRRTKRGRTGWLV